MNIICLEGDVALDPPINNLAAPARVFEGELYTKVDKVVVEHGVGLG